MTIANAQHGGGERLAQTIFDYWIDTTAFPPSAHYVALGHIHKMQRMPGLGKTPAFMNVDLDEDGRTVGLF